MIKRFFMSVFEFYRDGFRAMTWGRTLWVIILIKLFVMFVILRIFFFTPYLDGKSEAEKRDYVGSELTRRGIR